MQENLQLLIELQQIERKIQDLGEQKARAPKLIAALQEEAKEAETRLQEKQEMLKSLQKSRLELEREVEDLERRKARSKQKLLEVKSNKEYQAMLKEIDDLEDLIRGREDRILEQMETAEVVMEQIREHERLLTDARNKLEREGAQLEMEAAKADTLIESLEEQKEQMEPQISSDLLKRYQFLRANRGGVALAPVNEGTCQVCHMNLPPQAVIDLQKDEIVMYCPNCQRIIYWLGHRAYRDSSQMLAELE